MICEKQEHLEKVFHDVFPKLEVFFSTKSNLTVCGRFFLLQLMNENYPIFSTIFTIFTPENASKNFFQKAACKTFWDQNHFLLSSTFLWNHSSVATMLSNWLSNWLKIYLDVVISTVRMTRKRPSHEVAKISGIRHPKSSILFDFNTEGETESDLPLVLIFFYPA
jgi:hypothetical protein